MYCEASHAPDDVICSGSEDDYYESATARRLRYEAQALRYLNGDQPILISASLKGPFSKDSGWTNPWRSKRAKVARTKTPPKPTRKDEVVIPGTTSHVLEVDDEESEEEVNRFGELRRLPKASQFENNELSSTQATSLYPLPSPGSTHAPSVISNPYMDASTLNRVQRWRDNVKTTAASKEPFWAPNVNGNNQPGAKKRPPDSEWLKKKVAKRTKCDVDFSSSINSPIDTVVGNRTAHPSTSAKTTMGSSTSNDLTTENNSAVQHEILELVENGTRRPTKHLGRQAKPQIASPPDVPILDVSMTVRELSLPSRTKQRDDRALSPAVLTLRNPSSHPSGSQPALGRSLSGAPNNRASSLTQDPQIKPESSHEAEKMWRKWSSQQDAPSARLKVTLTQEHRDSSSDSGEEDTAADTEGDLSSADDDIEHSAKLETQQDSSFLYRTKVKQGKLSSPQTLQPATVQRAASTSSLSSLSSLSSSLSDETVSSDEDQPLAPSDPTDIHAATADKSHVADTGTEMAAVDVRKASKVGSQADNESSAERLDFLLSDTSSLTSLELPPGVEQKVDTSHLLIPSSSQQIEENLGNETEAIVESMSLVEVLSHNDNGDLGKMMPSQPPHVRDMVTGQDDTLSPGDDGFRQKTQSPWIKQPQEIVYRPQEIVEANDGSQFEPRGSSFAHLREANHGELGVKSQETTDPVGASLSQAEVHCIFNSDIVPSPEVSRVGQEVHSQTTGFLGLDIIASQALSAVRNLFPWNDNDAHLNMPPSQDTISTSSPDRQLLSESFDRSGSPERLEGILQQTTPNINRPSTPDASQSAISELASSIRPFSNFLTPSPVKQWKPKRTSLASGSRLPSTQVLADAATSNPWTNTSSVKSSRRVSFAPLPGEEARDADDDGNKENEEAESELPARPANHSLKKASSAVRAVSPPLLTHSEDMQDHDHRFAAHFQAMAKKDRVPRLGRRLLPTASQQVLGSPAVGAMAEAFIEAEQIKANSKDGMLATPSPHEQEQEAVAPLLNEESVDDVSAVIDNLGDFLNAWDVDAELAEARPPILPAVGASQMTGLEVNAWST